MAAKVSEIHKQIANIIYRAVSVFEDPFAAPVHPIPVSSQRGGANLQLKKQQPTSWPLQISLSAKNVSRSND